MVEKEVEIQVDSGLLCATDVNLIDESSYRYNLLYASLCLLQTFLRTNLERHLQALARDGAQVLLSSLFSLPIKSSPDGPLAVLPQPITQLPRAKPLPKSRPPTKWERFASAKGIQHKKRDRKIWDEEKQEWVNRWGRFGKNKEAEEQWLSEVPATAGELIIIGWSNTMMKQIRRFKS